MAVFVLFFLFTCLFVCLFEIPAITDSPRLPNFTFKAFPGLSRTCLQEKQLPKWTSTGDVSCLGPPGTRDLHVLLCFIDYYHAGIELPAQSLFKLRDPPSPWQQEHWMQWI